VFTKCLKKVLSEYLSSGIRAWHLILSSGIRAQGNISLRESEYICNNLEQGVLRRCSRGENQENTKRLSSREKLSEVLCSRVKQTCYYKGFVATH
jgi:hypothetical protein